MKKPNCLIIKLQTLTLVLLLFLCQQARATLSQGLWKNVSIHEIPTIKQLPVSAINFTFRDSEGYMWYGTVDGLCRDDGYRVHTFRSDFNTPGVFDINFVLCMAEDRAHRLWIGTRKGVYILDKRTYSIQKINIAELQTSPVYRILVRKNGDIWIDGDGLHCLYQLDKDGKLVKRHRLSADSDMVYEDSHGTLFYAFKGGGFYRMDKSGKRITISGTLKVNNMVEDGKTGRYWILTERKHIAYYDPTVKDKASQITIQKTQAFEPSEQLWQIVQDDTYHYLWLLTTSNLYVYRKDGKGNLAAVSTNGLLSSDKRILASLYKSPDGNIWVSTFDRPSFVINFHHGEMRNLLTAPFPNDFRPAITTLCRDDDGMIWYHQERRGLYLYDPQTSGCPISYREQSAVSQLPLLTVFYLTKSHQRNSMWAIIPTQNQVLQLSREGMQMKLSKKLDLAGWCKKMGNLEVIYEDNRQNLWIGTMKGLLKYDKAHDKVVCISDKVGNISDFAQATDGTVWCTVRNRGICRISASDKWKLYPYDIDFLTLDVTTDGTIWTSTGEGRLLAFSSSNPSRYEDYTEKAGLNGDMVDHVEVDGFNHLWLVTPQTIREFNPKNGALKVYSTTDPDVQQHRFLPRAVFCDRARGEMLFGTIPGIISFKSSMSLDCMPKVVKSHITDVKIMGRSIWLAPPSHAS